MSSSFSIFRCHVTGVPLDGALSVAVGTVYRFPINATDFAALPVLPWTVARLGAVIKTDSEPALWRTATKNPGLMIEIETISDAGSRTMQAEAMACWRTLGGNIKSRIRWMHIIGLHPHIQDRANEPVCERMATVATLQDDFPAKLFAGDNAAVAAIAAKISTIEKAQRPEPDQTLCLEEFFWDKEPVMEPWQQKRYDEALVGGFTVVHSSFALREEQA